MPASLEESGWVAGAMWKFAVTDKQGAPRATLVVRVTDRPGNACIGGDWKQLEIMSQDGQIATGPVWMNEGKSLRVLLSTAMCDSYPMLRGTFGEAGFTADHVHVYMGGVDELGHATGTRVRP